MAVEEEPIQIDLPELLTRGERARDTVFTALMWMLYVYLWVPLLSLVAWTFGVELAYEVMVRSGGLVLLKPLMTTYFTILGIIVAAIVIWSLSNRARFHNAARRRAVQRVTDTEMLEWFRVEQGHLLELRASKLAAIDFDEEGRPAIRSILIDEEIELEVPTEAVPAVRIAAGS